MPCCLPIAHHSINQHTNNATLSTKLRCQCMKASSDKNVKTVALSRLKSVTASALSDLFGKILDGGIFVCVYYCEANSQVVLLCLIFFRSLCINFLSSQK